VELARFRRILLQWYSRAHRDLPWRRTRDPYGIWISEVMLQQTRVAAVVPFYERFLKRFPDVASLAGASEQDLLAVWAGLGYYSRARNLQRAAKAIVSAGDSQIPQSHGDLLALAGVGRYTAAAIASIAYGQPQAAVDGNLLRVLARLDNDPGDITSARTRERFEVRATELLDRRHPGEFNQAMMELGATVCLPRNPDCPHCPVSQFCAGLRAGRVDELPVKQRKERKVVVEVSLLAVVNPRDGRILLRQRPAGESQMPGFWELPELGSVDKVSAGEIVGQFRHAVTFRQFRYTVQRAELTGKAPRPFRWRRLADLTDIPLTTAANKAVRCLF
jgi:A/G-specific adenine glycosylase